jgi:hypothetical protein
MWASENEGLVGEESVEDMTCKDGSHREKEKLYTRKEGYDVC